MDYDAIKLILTVVNMLITGLIGIFVWQNKRQQATVSSILKLEEQTKEAIDKLDAHVNRRFSDKCKRLNDLERQVSSMPTKGDIIRIHQRLDQTVKDSRDMILMMTEIYVKVNREK